MKIILHCSMKPDCGGLAKLKLASHIREHEGVILSAYKRAKGAIVWNLLHPGW